MVESRNEPVAGTTGAFCTNSCSSVVEFAIVSVSSHRPLRVHFYGGGYRAGRHRFVELDNAAGFNADVGFHYLFEARSFEGDLIRSEDECPNLIAAVGLGLRRGYTRVSVFFTDTDAPTMALPCESVTMPLMVPTDIWP